MGCVSSYQLSNSTFENTVSLEDNLQKIKKGRIVHVYDGDTLELAFVLESNRFFKKVYRKPIRIYGIDCAEIRSRNPLEKRKGLEAKREVENLVLDKNVKINIKGKDKYGRLLGEVIRKELNVGDFLINKKLAYKYTKGKKKDFSEWVSEFKNNTQA